MNTISKQAKDFKKKYFLTMAWRIKANAKIIEKYINPDEYPLYTFVAQKSYHPFDIFRTAVITLTNKRLIIGRKRVVFGYLVDSVTPDLYNDLKIHSGIIWGKIVIDTIKEEVVLTKIDKTALDEIETSITSYMMNEKRKISNDQNLI